MLSVTRVVALFTAVAISTPASAGNFFQEVGRALFGAPQPVKTSPASRPLVVTVRKRAKVRHVAAIARSVTKPEKPRARMIQAPPRVDPYIERDWFLRDETLRSGDIVVTATGALVLQAARQTGSIADFVSLKQARSVKQSEKDVLIDAIEQGRQRKLSYEPIAIDQHVLEALAGGRPELGR